MPPKSKLTLVWLRRDEREGVNRKKRSVANVNVSSKARRRRKMKKRRKREKKRKGVEEEWIRQWGQPVVGLRGIFPTVANPGVRKGYCSRVRVRIRPWSTVAGFRFGFGFGFGCKHLYS